MDELSLSAPWGSAAGRLLVAACEALGFAAGGAALHVDDLPVAESEDLGNGTSSAVNGTWFSDDLTSPIGTWPEGSCEAQAQYAGDANNLPAKSVCGSEPLTITA